MNAYRFGEFRLLSDRGQIFRGGEAVAIKPKAVKLLEALIERRHRVVPKDELMEIVWPGIFVEEQNVKHQIATIRRVLGPEIVQTAGRAGYQFVAKLEDEARLEAGPDAGGGTNLSVRSRPLVGRSGEAALLESLLLEHPMVTLVGPSGVGKTSLAKLAGHKALDRSDGGVWLVEVASAADADALAAAVAPLVGAELRAGVDPVGAVGRAIGRRCMLLILDGCEQNRAGVASLAAQLLDRCPRLGLLATSRIPLRVPGERLLKLEPLETAGPCRNGAEASAIPAVALLLDRAEAADARFELDDRDAEKAGRLCRMLDGLPLALEIAGARLPLLGFDALSERLAEFSLECADPLRNALDLSWSMLTGRGRDFLTCLSVFGGSFDLEAAQAVARPRHGRTEFLGGIAELADHSLLAVERGRVPRYRLLDTTRAYARAKLDEAPAAGLCRAMVEHYADRLMAADAAWNRQPEAEWRDALAPDLDSLRGALGWALAPGGDAALGLALVGRSGQLWPALRLFGEGQRWLEAAIALLPSVRVAPEVEAAVWRGFGSLTMMSDPPRAAEAFGRAVTLYAAAGDRFGEGRALAGAGITEILTGAIERAEATLTRACDLLAPSGQLKSYGACLSTLAYLYARTGRQADSIRCLEAALAAVRGTGDASMIAELELNLAEASFLAGDVQAAVARAEAGVERLRRAGGSRILAWSLLNFASYLEAFGDGRAARSVAREALGLAAAREDEVLVSLVELVALLVADAEPVEAARLLGWAAETTVRRSRPRQPAEQARVERLEAALARRLLPLRLQDARGDGAHWSNDAAADAATRLLEDDGREPRQSVPRTSIH